ALLGAVRHALDRRAARARGRALRPAHGPALGVPARRLAALGRVLAGGALLRARPVPLAVRGGPLLERAPRRPARVVVGVRRVRGAAGPDALLRRVPGRGARALRAALPADASAALEAPRARTPALPPDPRAVARERRARGGLGAARGADARPGAVVLGRLEDAAAHPDRVRP